MFLINVLIKPEFFFHVILEDWDDGTDDLTMNKTVWPDTWEDDDYEEDFYVQLKYVFFVRLVYFENFYNLTVSCLVFF